MTFTEQVPPNEHRVRPECATANGPEQRLETSSSSRIMTVQILAMILSSNHFVSSTVLRVLRYNMEFPTAPLTQAARSLFRQIIKAPMLLSLSIRQRSSRRDKAPAKCSVKPQSPLPRLS